jgi:hypothetical protein
MSQAYVGTAKRTFQQALIYLLESDYGLLGSRRILETLAEDVQKLADHLSRTATPEQRLDGVRGYANGGRPSAKAQATMNWSPGLRCCRGCRIPGATARAAGVVPLTPGTPHRAWPPASDGSVC